MSSALLLQLCHSPPKALGSTRKLHPCENKDGDLKSAGLGGGEERGGVLHFWLCLLYVFGLKEHHYCFLKVTSKLVFSSIFFFVLDDAAL